MRSAIDTNVISALWAGQAAAEPAERLLLWAREQGGLVVCGPVYAELLARPGVTADLLDDFLAHTSIGTEYDLSREIWQDAGLRFSKYAQRRKKSRDGEPRRLPADFVIGSHALVRADRLLSFNAPDYRQDFPELRVTHSPPRPDAPI